MVGGFGVFFWFEFVGFVGVVVVYFVGGWEYFLCLLLVMVFVVVGNFGVDDSLWCLESKSLGDIDEVNEYCGCCDGLYENSVKYVVGEKNLGKYLGVVKCEFRDDEVV